MLQRAVGARAPARSIGCGVAVSRIGRHTHGVRYEQAFGGGDLGDVVGVTSTELAVVVPELGQVVRCLDRIWAVDEVTPSSLPIDSTSWTRPQQLVRMSSLDPVMGASGMPRVKLLTADDVDLGKLSALVRA